MDRAQRISLKSIRCTLTPKITDFNLFVFKYVILLWSGENRIRKSLKLYQNNFRFVVDVEKDSNEKMEYINLAYLHEQQ